MKKRFYQPQDAVFPVLRAKHAPFFAHPAWKQDVQKILGILAEAKDFLTILRSRRERKPANRLWLLIGKR